MGQQIDKITLKGFKSIRDLEEFPLRNLNILIGANGAGKSNFVSFFTFLQEAMEGRLGLYVAKKGGADDHLFLGPKITSQINAYLHFRPNGYDFSLEPTSDNSLVFVDERIRFDGSQNLRSVNRSIQSQAGLFIMCTTPAIPRLCVEKVLYVIMIICVPMQET